MSTPAHSDQTWPAAAGRVPFDARLPALGLLLDEEARRAALARFDAPPPRVRIRRLRYKPGTAVHAALTVGEGPSMRWLLFAGYGPAGAPKLDKDRATAAARGHHAVGDDVGRWIVVPAGADRAFRASAAAATCELPGAAILSYNPRRRLVACGSGEAGDGWVAKLYRGATARSSAHLLDALHRGGVPVPAPLPGPHRAVLVARRVDGRGADPGTDGQAVAEALERLGRAGRDGTVGWQRKPGSALVGAAVRALRSVAAVLPDRRLGLDALSTAIVARWDQIDRLAPLLQHGDLSPDQVLVTGDGAVLVDLDNCGVFPRGWDQATWRAAQLADGVARPVALPGPEPDPALLAVAVAVRSPEPFVRQRPDWPVLIDRLAAAGLTAVAADARSACR